MIKMNVKAINSVSINILPQPLPGIKPADPFVETLFPEDPLPGYAAQ